MSITRIHQFKTSETTDGMNKVEKSQSSITALFNPLIIMMKIAGIFVDKRVQAGTTSFVMKWFYCIFMSLIFVADTARYFYVYKDKEFQTFSNRAAGIFAMTTFFFVGPIWTIGFLYLNSKHMPNILSRLYSYEERYDVKMKPQYLERYRRKLYITVVLSCLIQSVGIGLLLAFLPEDAILMTLLVGFPYSNVAEKVIPISFVVLKNAFQTFAMSGVSSFENELMQLIGRGYSEVTGKVKSLVEISSEENIEECIEDYRQQHECLTALLQSSNPVLQFSVLVTYASGIPVICFLLYGIAQSGLVIIDLIVLLEFVFFSLAGLLYYTLTGASLNSKAHEVKDVLFQIDLKRLSEKTIRQLQIFISRVNGPPIGINVYDMFIVDASSMLMLFGTILTYSIVIFQTAGPVVCSSTNTTNVILATSSANVTF